MTTALAVIAPRLRKLILMLSSDYDAEIVTAARSIGRVLADAGSDWHQFADAVTQKTRTSILCDDWRAMAQFCRGQARPLLMKSPAGNVFLPTARMVSMRGRCCEMPPRTLERLGNRRKRASGNQRLGASRNCGCVAGHGRKRGHPSG